MIFICFSLIIVSVISHSKYKVSIKNAKNGLSYSIKEVGFYEINNIHGEDSIKVKFSERNIRLFAIFTQDSQIALNHLFIDGYDSIKNVISSSNTVSYSVDAEEEVIFKFKSLKNKNYDEDDDEKSDENKIEAKFWLLPRETCGKSSIFEFGGTGSNLAVGLSEKLITSQNSNEIKYTNCIFSPLFDTSKPYSLSFDINSVGNGIFSRSKIDFFTDDVNIPDWTIKSDKEDDDENEKNYSTSKPFFVKYEIVQKSDDGQFVWPFNVETRMTRKMIGKRKRFDFNSISLSCFFGVFECCDSWSCFHDIEFEEMVIVKCDNENLIKIIKTVAIVVGIILFVIIIASIIGCCCCCCNCCGMIDCCCCCCADCNCCCCCAGCKCCSCTKKNNNEKQQIQQNVGSSSSIPQIMSMNKSNQKNDIELPLMDINQQQSEPVSQEIVANPYEINSYEKTEVQQQQQQTLEPISPYTQDQVPYF